MGTELGENGGGTLDLDGDADGAGGGGGTLIVSGFGVGGHRRDPNGGTYVTDYIRRFEKGLLMAAGIVWAIRLNTPGGYVQ